MENEKTPSLFDKPALSETLPEQDTDIPVQEEKTEDEPSDIPDASAPVYDAVRRTALPVLSVRSFLFHPLAVVAEEPLALLSEYELILVSGGSLSYLIGDTTVQVREGECLYCTPGLMRCRPESRQPAEYLCIRFWADGVFATTYGMRELPRISPFYKDEDLGAAARFLKRVATEASPDQQKKLLAALQLFLIELEGFSVRFSENDYIRAMKAYIFAHYREDITLEEIAVRVGLNPHSCTRLFRRYEHQSIGDFIAQLRISRAVAQLTSVSSTTEVAADLQLSENYFSSWFRQMTGKTPTEYRTILLNNYKA